MNVDGIFTSEKRFITDVDTLEIIPTNDAKEFKDARIFNATCIKVFNAPILALLRKKSFPSLERIILSIHLSEPHLHMISPVKMSLIHELNMSHSFESWTKADNLVCFVFLSYQI